ncbi:MAG: translation elongation factor Ts [Isosphaeraceae bacterium]
MAEITAKIVNEFRQITGLGLMECKKLLQEAEGDIKKATLLARERGLKNAEKRADRAAKAGRVEVGFNEDNTAGAIVELNCETDFVARNDAFRAMAGDLVSHLISTADAGAELLAQKFIINPAVTIKEALMELNARTGENVALARSQSYKLDGPGRLESYVHHDSKSGALVELTCGSKEQAARDEVRQLAKDLALQVVATNPLAITRDAIPASMVEEQKQVIAKLMENNPDNAKKPPQVQEKIAEGMLNKWFAENNLLDQEFTKDPTRGKVSDVIRKVASETGGGAIAVNRVTRYILGESAAPAAEAE